MNKINTKQFISELKRREIHDFWISNDWIGTQFYLFKCNRIKDYNQQVIETLLKLNNINVWINDERIINVLKQVDEIEINENNRVIETDLYIKEKFLNKVKWYKLLKYKNHLFKVDDFIYENVIEGYGSIYGDGNDSLNRILITNQNRDFLTICMEIKDLKGL